MLYVSENVSERLVTRPMALQAVREAFITAADGSAVSFPTLQAFGQDSTHRFSVKAARLNRRKLTGLKVGAYWPSSDRVDLPRGSSAVLFLDDTTGRIEALVQTSAANAYRTSAAAALSVQLLAVKNASTLAVFGAGHQAFHGVMAIHEIRPLTAVHVVNRTVERGDALVARLSNAGVSARRLTAREACEYSDMVLTVTASRQALLDDGWIRPGTHLCCMGADDRGKRELPDALVRRARLFADLVDQSTTVGEFQYLAAEIGSRQVDVEALGDVAIGRRPGRRVDADITIFDSSGIALQDIFLAATILREAIVQETATLL